MAEKDVKKEVKKIFKKFGSHIAWVMTVPTGYGRAGIEDFTCCAFGHYLAVETKADSKSKQTELQLARQGEVMLAGGIYIVIHADNLFLLELLLARMEEKYNARKSNDSKTKLDSSTAAGR